MVIAIEHTRQAGNIVEMHCRSPHAGAVARAIRRVTGEHPVPVPLSLWEVAYVSRELSLDEACALLRIVTVYQEDPDLIDRQLLAAEIMLDRQDQERWALPGALELNLPCRLEEEKS